MKQNDEKKDEQVLSMEELKNVNGGSIPLIKIRPFET